jgi:phytoene desaturase
VDGGFTFDMGPSIITAPDLLEDLFGASGVKLDEYVTLEPLTPYYRI